MSDFKFNCPSCGQHLSGDERYAGLQITCPTCRNTVVVPTAPAGSAGVRRVPSVPGVPAPPAPPAPPSPQKTCGLAIASLVCSIGTVVVGPFGFIPGIICGHLAKKKIRATPGLQGGGLAKAGLIIGYLALTVCVLAVLAFVAFFSLFATRIQQTAAAPRAQNSFMKGRPQAAAPEEELTTDTEPDGSGWAMKLAGIQTPAAAVTGRLHGKPFKVDKVTLENGWLNFRQGSDFFADREIDVVLFENDMARLSGRTFIVPKEEFGSSPHIWMKWKEAGGDVPKQRSFMNRYALRLEFGTLSGEKLPGKIYLCVPDKDKSFVAGTFEAQVKQ